MKRWIAIGMLLACCLVLSVVLWVATDEVEAREAELASVQAKLASTEAELAPAQGELEAVEAELEATQADLEALGEELGGLQTSYDGLLGGHGYTTRDPTYKEMLAFLSKDRTDRNEYVEDEYVCENFAMDVCNAAEEEGLRCAFVIVHYPDGGHAIVAFDTINKGLIHIEPQSDELVEPEIGRRYYKCVIPKPGYRCEKPDYDDTIEQILVVW